MKKEPYPTDQLSFNQPVVGMGYESLVTGVVLQTDGKMVVSGTFTNLGGQRACPVSTILNTGDVRGGKVV